MCSKSIIRNCAKKCDFFLFSTAISGYPAWYPINSGYPAWIISRISGIRPKKFFCGFKSPKQSKLCGISFNLLARIILKPKYTFLKFHIVKLYSIDFTFFFLSFTRYNVIRLLIYRHWKKIDMLFCYVSKGFFNKIV